MPKTTATTAQKAANKPGPKGKGKPTKAAATPAWVQPPFDPRITKLTLPMGSGVTGINRGYMVWDPTVPWSPPFGGAGQTFAKAPRVEFLYNPSTVAASYAIDNTSAQSSLLYPVANVTPNLVVPLNQTVSFTIMFDRTYELWGDSPLNPGEPPGSAPGDIHDPHTPMQKFGCGLDVLAMQQFTGMFSTIENATGGSNSANPFSGSSTNKAISGISPTTINEALNGGKAQGIFAVVLSYVFFSGSPNYGLTYYGYVSGWDVQYTHFAQNMVPMRAVIDVSYTLLPPQPKVSNAAAKGAATRVDSTPVANLTNPGNPPVVNPPTLPGG